MHPTLKLTLFDSREMRVLARSLERAPLDEAEYEPAVLRAVADVLPVPERNLSSPAKVATGTLFGIAGVGTIAGIAFAVAAENVNRTLEKGGLYQKEIDELETARRQRRIGKGVSFGLAGAAALAAILVLVTGFEDAPEQTVWAPLVTGDVLGVCAHTAF